MALETCQPIGDLCDLLGVSRCNPGVFDALVELMGEGGNREAERDARLARIAARAR